MAPNATTKGRERKLHFPSLGSMDHHHALSCACSDIPGLARATLALIPDGLVVAGIGRGDALDHETLIRSAAHCFAAPGVVLEPGAGPALFVEFVFVTADEFVVVQAGRNVRRLGLAVACARESNLALVITSTRRALDDLEAAVDLQVFDA